MGKVLSYHSTFAGSQMSTNHGRAWPARGLMLDLPGEHLQLFASISLLSLVT